MSQHARQGRTEAELRWLHRRGFMQAAAAWTAAGGFAAAHAQQRSNVVQLEGDVRLNGQRMRPDSFVQSGDRIETGPGSSVVFAIGDSAFHVRQNSRLTVERGATLHTVSALRILSGAVVSVWGRGGNRRIVTPTLTAGIRGTGVYTEVFPQEGHRSYFCNCWGTVQLSAGGDRVVSQSAYHQSFWGEAQPRGGRMLTAAPALNHTDEEVEFVAALVAQGTAWQVAGRRGVKDGAGFLDPGRPHPLSY